MILFISQQCSLKNSLEIFPKNQKIDLITTVSWWEVLSHKGKVV